MIGIAWHLTEDWGYMTMGIYRFQGKIIAVYSPVNWSESEFLCSVTAIVYYWILLDLHIIYYNIIFRFEEDFEIISIVYLSFPFFPLIIGKRKTNFVLVKGFQAAPPKIKRFSMSIWPWKENNMPFWPVSITFKPVKYLNLHLNYQWFV